MDVNGRWFRLADLFLALVASTAWYVAPGRLSWQPLVFATIPWAFRLKARRFPFQRTPLDLLLFLFLLTAAIGTWSAYDPETARNKFWIIVGAILLFYALAGQTQAELPNVAGLLGVIGFLFSAYFLLTHDWVAWPADVALLTRIGQRWMSLRPRFSAHAMHPNIVGGIIAILLPLLITFNLHLHRKRRHKWLWLSMAMSGLVMFAFIMTSSRAAWLSLVVALGFWFLWWLSQPIASLVRLSRKLVFIMMLAVMSSVGLWLLLSMPGGVSALLAVLPGLDSTTTRLELWQQAWLLAGDFPFTGGGLAAFAGLYSNYVRVIPFFIFSYSHNLLLDVLLEQGMFGLLALVGVIVSSVWFLATRTGLATGSGAFQKSTMRLQDEFKGVWWLRWMLFASLVSMVLHGLVDDALYGNLGTPLLFLLPGMVMAFSSTPHAVYDGPDWSTAASRWGIIVIVVAAAGLIFLSRDGLLAAWHANFGAVDMAKKELSGWPTNAWDDGRHVAALVPAAVKFQRALLSDPENRTAHHRLGAIAMLQREYDEATIHLEAAYAQADGHRGVSKSLGYSYVWAGELEKGMVVLDQIPEARDEMDVYSRWWDQQERIDLAEQARKMVTRLDEATINSVP